MYKLTVLDEVSSWSREQQHFVTTREAVFEMETEDEKQYRKLLKSAKSSWRTAYSDRQSLMPREAWEDSTSPEYETHTVCLLVTEPDETGAFVEKKLQYTRLPYPNQRTHLWLEVADWREDAEGHKFLDATWAEAVQRGDIRLGPTERKAWEKRLAKKEG